MTVINRLSPEAAAMTKEEREASFKRKIQDFCDLYWSDPETYGKNAGHILKEDENGVLQCYDYTGTVYICTFEEMRARVKRKLEEEAERQRKAGVVVISEF